MGHLDLERTVTLAKEQFYWPGMETDIKKFVTEVCSCVQAKKQAINKEAPLGMVTVSAPMNLIFIWTPALVHTNIYSLSRIISQNSHKPTLQEISHPRLQQQNSTMISYFALDYLVKYFTIKVKSLTMNFSRI